MSRFGDLYAQKSEIEIELGQALEWTRRDDIRASKIYLPKTGGIDDADDLLAEHRDWMITSLFALRKVFGPRVKALSL